MRYKLCDYSVSADQNLTHGDIAVYQLPSSTGVSKGDVAVLHDSTLDLISGGEKLTTVVDEPSVTQTAEQEPPPAIVESAEHAEKEQSTPPEEKLTTPSASRDNEKALAKDVQPPNAPPKAVPTKKTPKSGDNKKHPSSAKQRHHKPKVVTISASTRPSKVATIQKKNIL